MASDESKHNAKPHDLASPANQAGHVDVSTQVAGRLGELRAAWKAANLVPLWESLTAHKPPPAPDRSHLWSWQTIRPLVAQTIEVASSEAVERRVLVLASPTSRTGEEEATFKTITAAIQILLPGERARPHRHSMNALRFVLEGSGAATIVNGKECRMEVGDLILTPAWTWHEHLHRGEAPVVWLDALDVPLHAYLGAARFQPGPVTDLPQALPDTAYATPNLLPDVAVENAAHSPVFRYSYQVASAAVAAAPHANDGSRRVRYVNPLTGGSAMAFMDSHLVQLDQDTTTSPFRTTANAVCCVVEGTGESVVGGDTIVWREHDVFTLPQDNWISHKATGGIARMFMTSDRDMRSRLGLLREEFGNITS